MKSKVSPSHSARIEIVEKIYRALQSEPEITKFSMGPIKPAGNGQIRIKIGDDTGAIKITARGQTAVQIFRIYSKNIEKTKQDIRNLVTKFGWQCC